jgi:Domain of unknown function (DUF4384)
MKGIRLYALLASLTVAIACVPTASLADTPATSATANDDHPVFNEMEAGNQSRQLRLDELFRASDFEPTAKSATEKFKPKSKPKNAAAHLAKAPTKPSDVIAGKPAQVVVGKTPVKTKGQTELVTFHGTTDPTSLGVTHAIISNDATPVISASLDRPGNVPKYKAGDHMVIKLKALQSCNIMVFDYDNKGTITQLYPNDFDRAASLHAGEQIALGGDDSKYTLDVNGGGLEQIFVYAYPASDKPMEVAMLTPVAHSPFRATHMTRAQYDRLIAQSKDYNFSNSTTDDRSVSVRAKSAQKADNNSPLSTVSIKDSRQNEPNPVVPASAQKPENKIELIFQIEN